MDDETFGYYISQQSFLALVFRKVLGHLKLIFLETDKTALSRNWTFFTVKCPSN